MSEIVTTLSVQDDNYETIAKIQIIAVDLSIERATYTARVEFFRGAVIGLHQRYIGTFKRGFNDRVYLLKATLETFDFDDIKYEDVSSDDTGSPDLAREIRGPVQ